MKFNIFSGEKNFRTPTTVPSPPSPTKFRAVYHFRIKIFSRTCTLQMLNSEFTSIFHTKNRKFTPQKNILPFTQKYLTQISVLPTEYQSCRLNKSPALFPGPSEHSGPRVFCPPLSPALQRREEIFKFRVSEMPFPGLWGRFDRILMVRQQHFSMSKFTI